MTKMKHCFKFGLVFTLSSLIISIPALMEVQADQHAQTGIHVLIFTPIDNSLQHQQSGQLDADYLTTYMNEILTSSEPVMESEELSMYSAPDNSELRIWVLKQDADICRFIPWLCEITNNVP